MLKFKLPSLNFQQFRPFLIPGVMVIFIFVSGLFFIRPKISEILLIQKKLEEEETRLAKLTAKVASLEGLDQTELVLRVETTAKAVPSEKDLPPLLLVLKTLAAKNSLEIANLQVDPGKIATTSAQESPNRLSFLDFKIAIKGRMNDLKEFLTQVGQVAPLMVVRQVRIEVQDSSQAVQAELRLDAPFLLPPASLGSIEAPLAQITNQEEDIYQKLTDLDFALIEKEMPLVPTGKVDPFAF